MQSWMWSANGRSAGCGLLPWPVALARWSWRRRMAFLITPATSWAESRCGGQAHLHLVTRLHLISAGRPTFIGLPTSTWLWWAGGGLARGYCRVVLTGIQWGALRAALRRTV